MKRLDFVMNLVDGKYSAPSIEICSVNAERGFQTSFTTGEIEDATTEEWGTL